MLESGPAEIAYAYELRDREIPVDRTQGRLFRFRTVPLLLGRRDVPLELPARQTLIQLTPTFFSAYSASRR